MRRLLLPLCLVVATAACASSGAVPRPFPGAGAPPDALALPPAAPGHPGSADALVSTALDYTGVPYRNGGSDPRGFDCSGFVQFIFGRHGIEMPRQVREQFRLGTRVDRERLAPGDLVFFTTVAPGASHVGIAIGGDEFVHAPSSRGEVRVERLDADYWVRRFVGARRVG